MIRPQITEAEILVVFEAVKEHMRKVLKKHGAGAFVNLHEYLGKIEEERFELLGVIHQKNSKEIYNELLDVAIPTIFAAAGLKFGKTAVD